MLTPSNPIPLPAKLPAYPFASDAALVIANLNAFRREPLNVIEMAGEISKHAFQTVEAYRIRIAAAELLLQNLENDHRHAVNKHSTLRSASVALVEAEDRFCSESGLEWADEVSEQVTALKNILFPERCELIADDSNDKAGNIAEDEDRFRADGSPIV